MNRAKTLREALYVALRAEAAGAIVPEDALQTIRDAVAQAMPKRSFSMVGDRLAWQWTEGGNLNTVSWRVALGQLSSWWQQMTAAVCANVQGPTAVGFSSILRAAGSSGGARTRAAARTPASVQRVRADTVLNLNGDAA